MYKNPIRFWNRYIQKEEIETVYGDSLIRWLYETPPGKTVSGALVRPWLSKLSGLYQNSVFSRSDISKFTKKFKIHMEDYEEGPFDSFNEFFIRKFKEGQRSFVAQKGLMPAFAEGRYLGFEKISPESVFPVKGTFLSAKMILEENQWAKTFEGGPMLIARLCPVDYHRFHFPDDGRIESRYRLKGLYHSVNPTALKFKGDIFATNERQVSILETKNFGRLAYVEVGAFFVGKIIQSHPMSEPFKRGQEKGYFLFGGSTVLVMGEPRAWKPDTDILTNTAKRIETFVRLGDQVAVKK